MVWLAISLIEIVRSVNKQWDAWHGYMDALQNVAQRTNQVIKMEQKSH